MKTTVSCLFTLSAVTHVSIKRLKYSVIEVYIQSSKLRRGYCTNIGKSRRTCSQYSAYLHQI